MGMMKDIDTIIFDMDGTLLNTLDDLADAVNAALRAMEMPERSLNEVRRFVGNGVRRLVELSVPAGTAPPELEEVFSHFKEYYAVHCNDKTRAYEGVLPLLKKLKAEGYALAIVSNKLDAAVKELNRIYFDGMIDAAIGEREGTARKPAPDMVFAALGELGRTAEHAVYIGDSEVDLLTAEHAGLPCISVLWGFRSREALEECGGERFAETPEDILKYL